MHSLKSDAACQTQWSGGLAASSASACAGCEWLKRVARRGKVSLPAGKNIQSETSKCRAFGLGASGVRWMRELGHTLPCTIVIIGFAKNIGSAKREPFLRRARPKSWLA
jgi:hypothetical protein